MLRSLPQARSAAVEIENVGLDRDHVAMLAERGEVGVVLERKMSEHDMQVNACFMSSCVSNSQRDLRRTMTKLVHATCTAAGDVQARRASRGVPLDARRA